MNVLEKILEDIRNMRDIMKSTVATACFGKECENDDCTVCVCERAMEIISSYMDKASALEKKSVWEMDSMHHESYDLGRSVGWNECLEAIECIENDGWIPVEEDLPKETEKEYYPVMYVTTSYGVVAWGFYRVKDEQWYLYNDIMEEFESVENNKIIAWQPLPEAYHPKQTPVAEHIMRRFTRVE